MASVAKYRGAWSLQFGRVLFYGACVTLPWTAVQVRSIPLFDVLVSAAAVLLLLSPGRPRRSHRPELQLAVVAVLLATFVASEHAVDATASIGVGVRLLWVLTVLMWTVGSLLDQPGRILIACWSYIAGATISAAYTVWQVHRGLDLVFGRAGGLAGHVNDAGATLAIAVSLAAVLTAHRIAPLLAIAAFVAATIGLLLTGSVSGMSAAGGGLITVLVLRRVRPLPVIATATALATAWRVVRHVPALSGAVDPITRLSDTTGHGSGASTLALRLETWQTAWAGIRHDPIIGVGLDVASGGTITYSGRTTSTLATHNLWLLTWYQGGILLLIGLTIPIVAAAAGLRRVRQELRTARDLAAASLAAGIVFAISGPVLFQRYFWLPVALALAVAGQMRSGTGDRPAHISARSDSKRGGQAAQPASAGVPGLEDL